MVIKLKELAFTKIMCKPPYVELNVHGCSAVSLFCQTGSHFIMLCGEGSVLTFQCLHFELGQCYMDEILRQKLIQLQNLDSRVTYTLMDRINYPTQEYVIVGSDSKHQVLQTSPEVGIYGVLVRLVVKIFIPYL